MAVMENHDQAEKSLAEQFIAEAPKMQGVERITVELGNDQTGDPAMWLVFHLQPGVVVNSEWARSFNEYAAIIQTKILHSGMRRFPYTRLESAA
jgi:hypothetical protein